MKRNLLIGALLCLFFLNGFSQKNSKRELRGAWIATYANIDWPSRTQTPAQQRTALVSILDHHKATGINAIYFQIRSMSDALYQSNIEPWSADLTGTQGKAPNPLWDPMQFAIEECHKRGMEFHAWINPYRVATSMTSLNNTYAASHVGKQHPEWLLVGGAVTLNPGLSAVRDYILSVITDVTQRYDVDGIHFDDYFYPSGTYNDDAAYNADPRGFSSRADWRRDNVNLLIKRVYETVTTIKPWVKFGVSPSGIYRNSTNPEIGSPTSGAEHYNAVFADSKKWLQEGWVDYIEPQVYWYIGQTGADYSKIIPWWNGKSYGRHIYIGMAGYKVNDPAMGTAWANPSQIPNEIRMNRDAAYPNIFGQSIYNTSSLRSTTKLGFRDSLRLNFYSKPSLQPAMPWRDATPPTAPTALTIAPQTNNTFVLNWTKAAATNELDKAKQFVIYRGETPVIDTANVQNIVAITNMDETTYTDNTTIAGKKYYYVVTALDRFHNESGISNISDYTAPSISCPENTIGNAEANCQYILPDYTSLATVSDDVTPAAEVKVTQFPGAGTPVGKGVHTITLTATDASGNTTSCTFTVTVVDVQNPVIANASTNIITLAPANHKMHEVKVAYEATDNCGSVITSLAVSSNESSNGKGDGNTGNDWQIIDNHTVKLRAERAGNGDDRIYNITITATDASGNVSTQTLQVTVPHDNSSITKSVAAKNNTVTDAVANKLSARVLNNPATNHFIMLAESDVKKPVTINVMDNNGRIVETFRNVSNSKTLAFGSAYRPGVYYAEVMQDDKKQVIKLVKIKD